MRVASLAFALYVFWLLLSGHYDPFLLGAGALAAVAVAFAGRLFGYADREGHPVERIFAGFRYWPWLVVEIAKSALAVARIILTPSLPIAPRLVKLRAGPNTAVGMATYANSITLTPGTITVDADRQPPLAHRPRAHRGRRHRTRGWRHGPPRHRLRGEGVMRPVRQAPNCRYGRDNKRGHDGRWRSEKVPPTPQPLIPAHAGIRVSQRQRWYLERLDSRVRGNERRWGCPFLVPATGVPESA